MGEVADGSVTTVKLADNAVTSIKVTKNIKTSYITSDDTPIFYTGTAYSSSQKELRFIKKSANIPNGDIIVIADISGVTGSPSAAYIGFFFDSEVLPRVALQNIPGGTNFNILQGTCNIGNLSDGVHSIKIKMKNVDGGIVYNNLIEIHGRG